MTCKKEEFIDKNIKKQILKNLRYISNSKELENIKKGGYNCLCNYEYFKKIYLYYAENIENLILTDIIIPNKEYFKKLLTITFTDDYNEYIYKNSFKVKNGKIYKLVGFQNIQEDFIKFQYNNYINRKNNSYPLVMKNSIECSNKKKCESWVGYKEKTSNDISYSLYTNSNTSVSYTTDSNTTITTPWSGV